MILKDIIVVLQKMDECMYNEGIKPEDVEVISISLCDDCSVKFSTPNDTIEEMTLFEGEMSYEVTKPQEKEISMWNELSEVYRSTHP